MMWRRLVRAIAWVLGILIQRPRVWFYRALSSCKVENGGAVFEQPVLAIGRGTVSLGKCCLGVRPSPGFFSGYIHLEARIETAHIRIEDGVFINNDAAVMAERSTIRIGAGTLIGPQVMIFDSDFHHLDPALRQSNRHETASVDIGRNVFFGTRCTVLMGTTIGDDCVVAAGSVVSGQFPSGVIIGGVPAKIIRKL